MLIAAMAITDAGESKAWELLAASDPATVSGRAAVGFDPVSGCYLLASFGRHFTVHPGDRRILNLEPESEAFLKRDEYFFRLTVLWYLAKAGPARPSGTLVNPAALPGGEIFLRGTHVLPFDALAAKYATRPLAFLTAGAALGGKSVAHGDAAIVLFPLPKVPVTVVLWTEDDEFSARADLLFDATCTSHLPLDILWSIARISVLSLLEAVTTPPDALHGSLPDKQNSVFDLRPLQIASQK